MQIDIVIFPGFDELDVIGPYEVFRRGEDLGFHARLVTIDGRKEVVGAHGLRVQVRTKLDLQQRPDLFLIPGGGWNKGGPNGLRQELKRGALPTLIGRWHSEGTIMASVCTGAMALAAAGITKRRRLTTHARAMSDLRAAGATALTSRVVDDGNIISSGGVTSGIDLALHIIQRVAGRPAARRIADDINYPFAAAATQPRTGTRRDKKPVT